MEVELLNSCNQECFVFVANFFGETNVVFGCSVNIIPVTAVKTPDHYPDHLSFSVAYFKFGVLADRAKARVEPALAAVTVEIPLKLV